MGHKILLGYISLQFTVSFLVLLGESIDKPVAFVVALRHHCVRYDDPINDWDLFLEYT